MLGLVLALLAFFSIYPFVANVRNSLFHYNLTEPFNRYFVGWGNYVRLIQDHLFWRAVVRTLYYVILVHELGYERADFPSYCPGIRSLGGMAFGVGRSFVL